MLPTKILNTTKDLNATDFFPIFSLIFRSIFHSVECIVKCCKCCPASSFRQFFVSERILVFLNAIEPIWNAIRWYEKMKIFKKSENFQKNQNFQKKMFSNNPIHVGTSCSTFIRFVIIINLGNMHNSGSQASLQSGYY